MIKPYASLVLAVLLLVFPIHLILAQSANSGNGSIAINGLKGTVSPIKATAGVLVSMACYNPNASAAYLQFFDIAGSATPGTSTPRFSVGMAQTTAHAPQLNANFSNAIKVAALTTATGGTAVSTGVDCAFFFR